MKSKFSNSAFNNLLENISITCLDIGARGGISQDLLPISKAVNFIGFEPDKEECEKLNKEYISDLGQWRSLKYIPVAIGNGSNQILHLYHHRGCSSLLEANLNLSRQFKRDDYYKLDSKTTIPTSPLDTAAKKYGFTDAAYMKIDIQGAEGELFETGITLISSSILAIRVEVSFRPLYKNQPLFCEINTFLQENNFLPVEFCEQHHWRRLTKKKHPYLIKGHIPYSHGELIHGDMLYFKNPEELNAQNDNHIENIIKLGLLALCYEHIDFAYSILTKNIVKKYLNDKYAFYEVDKVLGQYSSFLAKKYKYKHIRNILYDTYSLFLK